MCVECLLLVITRGLAAAPATGWAGAFGGLLMVQVLPPLPGSSPGLPSKGPQVTDGGDRMLINYQKCLNSHSEITGRRSSAPSRQEALRGQKRRRHIRSCRAAFPGSSSLPPAATVPAVRSAAETLYKHKTTGAARVRPDRAAKPRRVRGQHNVQI